MQAQKPMRKGRAGREIAKLRELRTGLSHCKLAVNLCNATIRLVATRLKDAPPLPENRQRLRTAMAELQKAHQGPARQPFCILLSKAGTALSHIQ